VQGQVGHADHETTSRIYPHVIRRRRAHGAEFDRLVTRAREQVGALGQTGLNVD
jgi:hypothetical protein